MSEYLASRIEKNKLDYNDVIYKFRQFKTDIDAILEKDGYVIDNKGNVSKIESGG